MVSPIQIPPFWGRKGKNLYRGVPTTGKALETGNLGVGVCSRLALLDWWETGASRASGAIFAGFFKDTIFAFLLFFVQKLALRPKTNSGRGRPVAVPLASHGTVRGLEPPSDLGPPAANGQPGTTDHCYLHDDALARRIPAK